MQEKDYKYPLYIDSSMYDENLSIHPFVYHRLAMAAIEEHLRNIHADSHTIAEKYGAAWVILCFSVELRRRVHPLEKLCLRTWCSAVERALFRREFAIYDENDEIVAAGINFSTLLNMKTRRLFLDRSVLDEFMPPHNEKLIEADYRFDEELDFASLEKRVARPSLIDGLGHVNNTHYSEFAYDTFDENELALCKKLKRLDIYFKGELRRGCEFSIEKAAAKDRITVRGIIDDSGKESFIADFKF